MKFAQYLQETQTPEWKKAYIDYRGLKKRITAIRRTQEGLASLTETPSSSQGHLPPTAPRHSDEQPEPSRHLEDIQDPLTDSIRRGSLAASISRRSVKSSSARLETTSPLPPRIEGKKDQTHELNSSTLPVPRVRTASHGQDPRATSDRPRRPSIAQKLTISSLRRGVGRPKNRSVASHVDPSQSAHLAHPFDVALPLSALLPQLSPQEIFFFTALDAELDKIESFYLDREKEMLELSRTLKEQLRELSDHRKLFYSVHSPDTLPWPSALNPPIKFNLKSRLPKKSGKSEDDSTTSRVGDEFKGGGKEDEENCLTDKGDGLQDTWKARTRETEKRITSATISVPPSATNPDEKKHRSESGDENDKEHAGIHSLDPEDYPHAKKKLKKAVLEHYRGLEMLKNYRILNITGFKKALKKFEKVTKIRAQDAYMKEKVETSAFASDLTVSRMLEEIEEEFAARFERGNKKKAMTRLRAGSQHKSHHFSTFRSGIVIGLAFPALVSGLYQSFQQDTREAIPGWDALLYVYGIFLIPVLFSLLVGVNLLVWSRSRINYVFIFELDVRTRLDHREYFETPGILLATLCYAFWLSFSRAGSPSVSPTIWPLVWLGFTGFIVFDPLPLLFRPSRYWLVRKVGKLLTSGTRRVEFTDFWLGDQFCSLIFTLSNLYLFVCVYAGGFDPTWRRCSASSHNWPVAFALASLPLFIRLVQSVRRYADSKLITHLINGGKYGSGIISYLFYYNWRHQGGGRGASFALWCLFNTIYSTYASSWDLLMDWSIMRVSPHVKHPLLRPNLVYSNYIPLYYFAMISNVLIRFIWVFYIPQKGPDNVLRTFIAGILEMLRRWQWNFYRLENEHLGNMDQYRVTREVPLPYSVDTAHEDDGDEDGDEDGPVRGGWLSRQLPTGSHRSKG